MTRIITMATPDIAQQCAALLDNQRGYAAAHGYEHIVYSRRHPDFADVHPVYSRLGFLLDACADGCDVVIWADADVAFMDYSWCIADLIAAPGQFVSVTKGWIPAPRKAPAYWLAGYDQMNWPGPYLCFGLLVFRNVWMTRMFLQELSRVMRTDPDIEAREQIYGNLLLADVGFVGVRRCSGDEIGCFAPEIWHDSVIWKPGMPTVHLAGPATWELRAKLFTEIYSPQVRRA